MEKMTSFERVMTVVNHGIPDRVPVDLHNFLTTIAYAGFPMAEALQSGEMLAEAQLKFWRDFGHDMLLVENGVVAEAGACGCRVEFCDDRPPRVAGHVLAEGLEKIDELEVPDPATTPPMSYCIDAVRILRKELGEPGLHHGTRRPGAGGAGSRAARLRTVHPGHDAQRAAGADPQGARLLRQGAGSLCAGAEGSGRARHLVPARWAWTSSARACTASGRTPTTAR